MFTFSSTVCNFIVHERCVTSVVTPCSGIAPCIIKNPVSHCWSEPTHHKRKFCTVCRKRLDETPAVHCMSKYTLYCIFFFKHITLSNILFIFSSQYVSTLLMLNAKTLLFLIAKKMQPMFREKICRLLSIR